MWAGLTFNLQPALSAGIFFELLWLDLFPAGTFIPPHALLSLSVTLGILACLPGADMGTTALLLVLTLPLAYVGAWAEQSYRKRQNLSYNSLIIWNRRGVSHPYTPDRLVFQALVEMFVLNFTVYLASASALLAVIRLARPWLAGGLQPAWPMLWIAACAGAILALRVRKAYALAGVSLAVGVLISL